MPAFRNIFQSIPLRRPKKNIFDLSFDNLLTLNFGDLVPIMCKEVLPGDTWQVQSSTQIRFAPMLAPIMHRVNCYIHYFFVPNRIIWSNFEDFITGGKDGTASPTLPFIDCSTFWGFEDDDEYNAVKQGSLWDYLGLPSYPSDRTSLFEDAIQQLGKVSLLPFAAYRKIYEDYYKDQNLEDEFDVKAYVDAYGEQGIDFVDAQADDNIFQLKKRAWEKDYFTSALPWPQRGGDVHLPMSGDAEVYFEAQDGKSPILRTREGAAMGSANNPLYPNQTPTGDFIGPNVDGELNIYNQDNQNGYVKGYDSSPIGGIDPNGTLKADMSEVTSATINELRRSLRLQEWLEKNARSGARYIEQILSHFGVRSSDGRLDRAEYLGGGKCPISISEVLQTSETTNESPLADMAGHGYGVGNSNKFRRFFEEHGYVFGIMSIVPRSSYGQGVPRHFTKFDKFDYAWPEFANLGEQEILNKELVLSAVQGQNDKPFGYTPRYAEYKFSLNEFHGDFRGNLAFWHLGRMFQLNDAPSLNEDFVHVRADEDNLNRIFAVQENDTHHLLVECYNNITVRRTLPKFGVPTI